MAKCNRCHKEIQWCTVNGKKIPVNDEYIDVTPHKSRVMRIVTDDNELVEGLPVGDAWEGEAGYKIGRIVHWVTCGNA